MCDVEQINDVIETNHIGVSTKKSAAIDEICPHIHVREQASILKYITDMAAFWRQVRASGAIEQHIAADGYPSMIGRKQSGDGVEHRRLSGTRWRYQCHQPCLAFERTADTVLAKTMFYIDIKGHGYLARPIA